MWAVGSIGPDLVLAEIELQAALDGKVAGDSVENAAADLETYGGRMIDISLCVARMKRRNRRLRYELSGAIVSS